MSNSDLIGTWQAVYDNYHNVHRDWDAPSNIDMTDPISGTDTIVLQADNTYSQRFVSDDGVVIKRNGTWRRIDNEGDGIKLEMTGLAYVANGLRLIDGPLYLGRQFLYDSNFREVYGRDLDKFAARMAVDYPDDGYLFLYPRACDLYEEIVLLQMVYGFVDPDEPGPTGPVFQRIAG